MDRRTTKYHLSNLFKITLCIACICFAEHSFAYNSLVIKTIPAAQRQADSTHFDISGRVIDNAGQPLPGATVFISNSKWATSTNSEGLFKIAGLPPGNYEVIVRMMGFLTFTRALNIVNSSVTITVNLKPDAISLNEVKINAKPDGNRERYLKIFTETFVGRSDNARKSKIVNSDVIKFIYLKKQGTLTARSTDFIKIENASLGYNVNFLLNSFSFNQQEQIFAYDGKVFFEELGGDEKKISEWNKNRLLTYKGSMQHFFKALYAGAIEAEGFKVYKIADSELGQTPAFNIAGSVRRSSTTITRVNIDRANLKPVNADSLTKTVGMFKVLNLPLIVNGNDTTRFYICYTRKNEPSRFLNSAAHLNIPVPNAQISRVYQTGPDNIILNKDGSLSPVNTLLLQGYWAWQRVADLLPDGAEFIPGVNSINAQAKETGPVNTPEPLEKIHIQTDRSWYLSGDTVWMKLYIVDAYNRPSASSNVCFVELIDKNKRIIKNLRLPVNMGIAWGGLALNDSLVKKGAYILRAYTNSTQKNGNSFYYKTIRVTDINLVPAGLKNVSTTKKLSEPVADSLNVKFYPEGGLLITDINSRMALTISAAGKPVSKMQGYIANEMGYHIALFETNDNGIAAFNLKPLKEGKYWAVLTLPNGVEKRFALPRAQPAGIAIAVKQNNDDIVVNLRVANVSNTTALTLVVKANGRVQYQTEKLLAAVSDSIVVSKADVPEGMLQLSLYTDEKILVAERMVYNHVNQQQLNVKFAPNKAIYKPYDKVDIDIVVTDADGRPVSGNFSVSVNNEADVTADLTEKTIFTDLLGPNDTAHKLKQFNTTTLTAHQQSEMDDLLLTIKPEQLNVNKTIYEQADSTYYAVQGQITTSKGKPVASGVVGLFSPNGGPALTTTSDNNGRFIFNDVQVKRGDPFYVVAKDKNKDLVVTVDKYEPPLISDDILADTTTQLDEYNGYIAKRIADLKSDGILGTELKEVIIKDKKAEPTLKELVLQNSSNMGGRPDQVLTFIDLLGCTSSTLGECLALKLNGVTAKIDERHRIQLYARGRPLAVFVDGTEQSEGLTIVSSLSVASVELLKGGNASAYGMRGGNGVIVITTKNGSIDYWAYEQEHYVPGSTKTSPVQRFRFENGFDEPGEFFVPDYSTSQAKTTAKWRPTIFWSPNIITGANGTAKLSYFTNNVPGTYRVTIEGLDSKGRIARKVFNYTVSK